MVTLLKIDDAKVDTLEKEIDSQVIAKGVQRTLDKSYPVLRVKTILGEKNLFYVPRIKIPGGTVNEDGSFNAETANVHSVLQGTMNQNYRCTAGLTALPGYSDGLCPLDEVQAEVNDVVNQHAGFEIDDSMEGDDEASQKRRKDTFKNLYKTYGVVGRPTKRLVFPVVVIPLDQNADGVHAAHGEDAAPYLAWYDVSDYIWTTKWLPAFSDLGIKSPAGQYFVVRFPENPDKKGDTRYAGQNVTVQLFQAPESSKFNQNRGALDEMASDPEHPWTRSVARSVLPAFGFRPREEMNQIAKNAKALLESKTATQPPIGTGLTAAQLPAGITDADPAPAAAAPVRPVAQPAATPVQPAPVQAAPATAAAKPNPGAVTF